MRDLEEMAIDLANSIHHGECLYDEKMFNEFIEEIDAFKDEAIRTFNKNREELEG